MSINQTSVRSIRSPRFCPFSVQLTVAIVEAGNLLGRSIEIGEQPAYGRGALDPELRAEHSAVVGALACAAGLPSTYSLRSI